MLQKIFMNMEFIPLREFLLSGAYLQNGDYVYCHNKEGYPLQKDMDASMLYVITATDGHKLETISFSGLETMIDLEKGNDFWWILKLPEPIRKKIGL